MKPIFKINDWIRDIKSGEIVKIEKLNTNRNWYECSNSKAVYFENQNKFRLVPAPRDVNRAIGDLSNLVSSLKLYSATNAEIDKATLIPFIQKQINNFTIMDDKYLS